MSPREVFVFTEYGMGHASGGDLQLKLARKFLSLLLANGKLPAQICFYTDGVKLCVEGSPVLEELRRLEAQGVELVLCSTCLDAFGLADKVAAGVVGGMPDILEALANADKVVSL